MDFHHVPVLLREVLHWLNPQPEGVYLDGTLGGGGHSHAILTQAGSSATLYGIDRDPQALAAATERLKGFPGFHPIHGNFHQAKALLAGADAPPLHGALLDLGVSSPQLDHGERGFSYHEDAPLDMRMDFTQGITAAQLVNAASQQELTRIILAYGEEKWAARIAAMICEHRAKQPIRTTGELVRAVDAAIPKAVRRKDDGHPARRTFQAIRIAVNDELESLDQAICSIVDMLQPGGVLAVITFHSLEDRLVKRCFQRLERPCICPPKAPICTCGRMSQGKVLGNGAIPPGDAELAENPRSRSSKLRVFRKGG